MLLIVLTWVLSIVSNALLFYPGLHLLSLEWDNNNNERWSRSMRFFRASCSAWNLLILVSFFLVELCLKANYQTASPGVNPESTVALAIFSSLLLAATIGSLAGLFFSLNLRESFDGFCAGGIVWLMFCLLFAVLISYEITLSYFGSNAILMIAKIYMVCTILSYLIYLLAAWFQTYGSCQKLIARFRSGGPSKSSERDLPPVNEESPKEMHRRLFRTALVLLSFAWLPFVYTCLARLYDLGTFELSWQNHIYLGSSIAVVTSLAMPLAVLLQSRNRRLLSGLVLRRTLTRDQNNAPTSRSTYLPATLASC